MSLLHALLGMGAFSVTIFSLSSEWSDYKCFYGSNRDSA